MKPDWDKLMAEFKGSETALVADVDCTKKGKPLCEKVGVKGYPTIKWGDADDLQDYQGGRDFSSLQKFATENLKPQCSPANLDLCEGDKKTQIEELMAMDLEALEKKVEEGEAQIKEAEETFQTELQKLQDAYQKLQETKDSTIEEVKSSGLGMTKSVVAYLKKNPKEEKSEL